MLSKTIKSMRRRVGPVGLSLLAAALTAVAFAAVSVAQDGDGGNKDDEPRAGAVFEHHVGPPPELSEEDRAAMEEFRACIEENGGPALPDPGEMRQKLESGERPDPPSEEEMEKLRKAHEACEDKLPEGVQVAPGPPCGPPPGAPGEARKSS
jgi:hypothetical protein